MSFVICHLSFVICHLLFVIGKRLKAIDVKYIVWCNYELTLNVSWLAANSDYLKFCGAVDTAINTEQMVKKPLSVRYTGRDSSTFRSG
ncbi:hypothetical protein NIES2100_47890 [Calothrix sp. NIES-2100]|nr:hypothetical protein NIES2100_47890 [Calothrix sp. NIES-2100]